MSSHPPCCGFFSSSLSPSQLRQAKLEEALALATDFQNSLQDFINWLTLAEQSLNIAPPASLILNAVLAQIDEHKVPNSSLGWRDQGWHPVSPAPTGCLQAHLASLMDMRTSLLFAGVCQ